MQYQAPLSNAGYVNYGQPIGPQYLGPPVPPTPPTEPPSSNTGMIIGIVILILVLVGGILGYIYRDKIFKTPTPALQDGQNVDANVNVTEKVDKSCPTEADAFRRSCGTEMLRKTCKISNMDLLCGPGENTDTGCEGPNCWFYPSQVLIEHGGTKEPPISWNKTKQAPMAICAALVKNCQKLGGTEQDCVCIAQKCVNGGEWNGEDAMELYTRLVKEGMDSTLMSFQDAQDLIALGCPKT